jgi:hypothetical protein
VKTHHFLLALIFSAFSTSAFAQPKQFILFHPRLAISPDSAEQLSAVRSLAELIRSNKGPAKDNPQVWRPELPATAALLAQVRGLDTLQMTLDNLIAVNAHHYKIQLSFITKGSNPFLAAAIDLLAVKEGEGYQFYSPFSENTRLWSRKTVDSFDFYYRFAPDTAGIKTYVEKAEEFDKKLKAPAYRTTIYFADDAINAMHALGINYLASEANAATNGFSAFGNNISLFVFGHPAADPAVLDIHDCWHIRLRNTPKTGEVNKFMDEACAYLYGGSWGYSWNNILDKFKTLMAGKTDWLAVYKENKQFGENQAKHLYAAYVIDALLIRKIEKDKGFAAVMPVICSGKKASDDAAFFAALEKADGITTSNFNAVIAVELLR